MGIASTMDYQAKILDMHAANDKIDVKTAMLRHEAQAAMDALEAATGLHACFRAILSRRWLAGDGKLIIQPPYTLHRSSFCEQAKARDLSACMKDDSADLPALFASTGGSSRVVHALPVWPATRPGKPVAQAGPLTQPVARVCHAGAGEVLIPLWQEGVLTAMVFVGQFRLAKDEAGRARTLPALDEPAMARLLMMGRLLQSYLLEVQRRLEAIGHDPSAGRAATIEHYLRTNLASGPTLGGLAEALCLSPSRASHVVRQVTGECFQDLVERRRLALAKDLLAAGHGKVGWVAMQSGLSDVAYFCRYFKRKTGMTPTAWRRRHRQAEDV